MLDAVRSQLAGYGHLWGDHRTTCPPELRDAAVAANRAYQAAEYGRAATMLPEMLRAADAYDGFGGRYGRETQFARCMAYAVSAKLLTKLGEAQLAWLAADRATHAAMALDSVAARGVAAYQVACALLQNDRTEDAERLAVCSAERLMTHVKSGVPEVISLAGALWLVSAVIAGRQSDRSRALERLATAEDLADMLAHDGNHAWTAFGPTNVHIHRASVQAELGDPYAVVHGGIDIDTEALPAGLNGRRSRVHLDLAWAHTRARNDLEAALHLHQAERIAPELLRFETVARELVRELIQRARGPQPALRAMAERAGVLA